MSDESGVRVEYLIVSDRTDGHITVHEPPFESLDRAMDCLVWKYRWQESNMRVESRTVTTSPLAAIADFEVARDAALLRRRRAFAQAAPLPAVTGSRA